MRRRTFLTVAGTEALAAQTQTDERRVRLKQGVTRRYFPMWSAEELAARATKAGLRGIDLVGADDWPAVKKYGSAPPVTLPGRGSRAGAAGVPNIIAFTPSTSRGQR